MGRETSLPWPTDLHPKRQYEPCAVTGATLWIAAVMRPDPESLSVSFWQEPAGRISPFDC